MDPRVKPYAESLDRLHGDIFAAVEPLGDAEINWAHPHLSNTIGILLRHVAGSERYWIGQFVGGRPAERDRDTEFVREALAKEPLVEGLRRAHALVTEVLEGMTAERLLEELEITYRGKSQKSTRAWALLHSLQHTAYHLGQIQLFKKMATSA